MIELSSCRLTRRLRLTRRQWLALLPMAAAGAEAKPPAWRKALPGYRYQFPRDHFSHPDFQTEWWYYTGNVTTPEGRPFGFELTFFRQGIDPVPSENVWSVDQVYLAHLALSDIQGQRFHHHERLNRSGPGLAGVDLERQRIWNGNWRMEWRNGDQHLAAVAPEFNLRLALHSGKPPVINGRDGISQKSPGEGRASHYISFTRLLAQGELELAGQKLRLAGTAWMDHEIFTNHLGDQLSGWDWLSLQLANGTELMVYRLRRQDRSIEPLSHGTFVDGAGRARGLSLDEFSFTPTGRTWNRYPLEWRVKVPSLGIDLEVSTPMENQQLVSTNRFSPSYWEGAVRVKGQPGPGVGYLEMTGYDRALTI